MFAAPCLQLNFGIPGVFNKIADLDPPRLLALFILVPIAVPLWRNAENRRASFFDILLGSYFLLVCVLAMRWWEINSLLRAVLGLFLDIALPYFVFSRALRSASDVNRTLLAFAFAAMPLAAAGLFEFWKGWRAYAVIASRWETFMFSPYLFRDGLLRAGTTSIEPIAFGFLCMTGAGCLLAVRTPQRFDAWRYAAMAVLLGGLLSSLSRGPWLGFALCAAIILAINLKAAFKLLLGLVPALVGLSLFSSSLINRFINLLPFIGSADPGSETYRSQLLESSLLVIQRNPLFGSNTFIKAPELQRLVQGQGIIDIVNSYLQIALQYGLIALALFVLFFFLTGAKIAGLSIKTGSKSVNYTGVFAVLLAMLFTITTTSSVSIIPHIYWAFGGLSVALIRMGVRKSQHQPAESVASKTEMRVLGA
jgi:O-antigen ligase